MNINLIVKINIDFIKINLFFLKKLFKNIMYSLKNIIYYIIWKNKINFKIKINSE